MSRYAALAEWRRQVLAGERSPTQVDPLYSAACREAHAEGLARQFPELAAAFAEDARQIILKAVAEQRRGKVE